MRGGWCFHLGVQADIITREANTIGTLYLRAGLLDDAQRDRLRAGLRDYTAARLRLFETEGMMLEGDINAELDSINRGIWEVIAKGSRKGLRSRCWSFRRATR